MSILATIDALHAELDAHPDAHDTRRLLGDALEEAGDERAEGYRALGVLRKRVAPSLSTKPLVCHGFTNPTNESLGLPELRRTGLPQDWWDLMESPLWSRTENPAWAWYATRREAEDAAALAFAQLPESRRRELLATSLEATA